MAFWGVDIDDNESIVRPPVTHSSLHLRNACLKEATDPEGKVVLEVCCFDQTWHPVCVVSHGDGNAPLNMDISGPVRVRASGGKISVFGSLFGTNKRTNESTKAEEVPATAPEVAPKKKQKVVSDAPPTPKAKPESPAAKPAAEKAKPAEKAGMVTLQNGLQMKDITVGEGRPAKRGSAVAVRYRGLLTNGVQFDSNMPKGRPFTFKLGEGEVIRGWDEGVAGMKVGGRRQLVIPAALGYGARGAPPDIPPHATLVFEVELLSIR